MSTEDRSHSDHSSPPNGENATTCVYSLQPTTDSKSPVGGVPEQLGTASAVLWSLTNNPERCFGRGKELQP